MEQVLNIYYLTIDHLLCLNVWMEPVNLKQISHQSGESIEEDKCGGKLLTKNAYTNITGSPDGYVFYKIPENWCELQDKILRVLTYKYYNSDHALRYYHHGHYVVENGSSTVPGYYDEEEMEVCNLQEYADMSLPVIEVQVAHEFLPMQLSPQNVTINEDKFWVKTWKLIKNIFTFKSCRY